VPIKPRVDGQVDNGPAHTRPTMPDPWMGCPELVTAPSNDRQALLEPPKEEVVTIECMDIMGHDPDMCPKCCAAVVPDTDFATLPTAVGRDLHLAASRVVQHCQSSDWLLCRDALAAEMVISGYRVAMSQRTIVTTVDGEFCVCGKNPGDLCIAKDGMAAVVNLITGPDKEFSIVLATRAAVSATTLGVQAFVVSINDMGGWVRQIGTTSPVYALTS